MKNEQIENAVLGQLLMSADAQILAIPRLFEEMFYSEANRAVFKALRQLFDVHAHIDFLTVYEALKRSGEDPKIGGIYYLTKLQSDVSSPAHLSTHITILHELFLKREINKISHKVANLTNSDEADIFDTISKFLSEVESVQNKVLSGRSKTISDFIMEMLKQMSDVKNTGVLGLKTGLESIDKTIGGLVSPDLIILAARPGHGKTALALSITLNLCIKGDIPCAWFSLEMDGVQLVRRLASMHSGVDHSKIRNGHTSEAEERLVQDSSVLISKKKIFIEDDPTLSIRDIRAKAAILKKKHDIKYIVVDYLQLMEGSDKGKSREQVVADISRGLKVIAKELNIPVIALSQLNRSVEARGDKIPCLADLRESGAIEQDADECIFLMRPEYYDIHEASLYGGRDTRGLVVVKIDKNRHGQTGTTYAHFDGSKMFFSNYA